MENSNNDEENCDHPMDVSSHPVKVKEWHEKHQDNFIYSLLRQIYRKQNDFLGKKEIYRWMFKK